MCSCPALAQYGYNLGLSCWVQVRKLTYGLAFPAWLQTKCITMDLSGSQEHWLPWLPFAYLLCSIRVPWDGALALDSRLCLLLIVRKIYQSFPQRRNQFHESNCQWAKMEAHITWICKRHWDSYSINLLKSKGCYKCCQTDRNDTTRRGFHSVVRCFAVLSLFNLLAGEHYQLKELLKESLYTVQGKPLAGVAKSLEIQDLSFWYRTLSEKFQDSIKIYCETRRIAFLF